MPTGQQDSLSHVGPLTHAAGKSLLPYSLRGARNLTLRRFDPAAALRRVDAENTLFRVPGVANAACLVNPMAKGAKWLPRLSCRIQTWGLDGAVPVT